jgi:hypothetical protein
MDQLGNTPERADYITEARPERLGKRSTLCLPEGLAKLSPNPFLRNLCVQDIVLRQCNTAPFTADVATHLCRPNTRS